MTTIKETFAKHIDNEYPPEFVFYTTPNGELGSVWIDELDQLEASHDFVGFTDDSITHSHLIRAGNLPILESKSIT